MMIKNLRGTVYQYLSTSKRISVKIEADTYEKIFEELKFVDASTVTDLTIRQNRYLHYRDFYYEGPYNYIENGCQLIGHVAKFQKLENFVYQFHHQMMSMAFGGFAKVFAQLKDLKTVELTQINSKQERGMFETNWKPEKVPDEFRFDVPKQFLVNQLTPRVKFLLRKITQV